jgi:hypothetical protein
VRSGGPSRFGVRREPRRQLVPLAQLPYRRRCQPSSSSWQSPFARSSSWKLSRGSRQSAGEDEPRAGEPVDKPSGRYTLTATRRVIARRGGAGPGARVLATRHVGSRCEVRAASSRLCQTDACRAPSRRTGCGICGAQVIPYYLSPVGRRRKNGGIRLKEPGAVATAGT